MSVQVKGCLSLCVRPVLDWQSVQGVPCSIAKRQLRQAPATHNPEHHKWQKIDGWMNQHSNILNKHIWKAPCLSQQQEQDLKRVSIWFLLCLRICFTYEPRASCCAGRVKTTDKSNVCCCCSGWRTTPVQSLPGYREKQQHTDGALSLCDCASDFPSSLNPPDHTTSV